MNQRSLFAALLLVVSCTSNQGKPGSGAGGSSGSAGAGSSGSAGSVGAAGSNGGAGTAVGSSTGSAGSTGAAGSAGSTGAAGSAGAAGVTGAAGATGSAGTTGAAGSATGNGGPHAVLQRGGDNFRSATFVEPALTPAAAMTMQPNTTFDTNAKFNGSVQASVLYLEDGPPAAGCPAAATGCLATARAAHNGLFFASTQGSGVYALDEATGLTVWHSSIGGGGGDGIRGTPVIDGPSRTLFVALGASGHHEVHALSVDDGSERAAWPVMLSAATLKSGSLSFNTGDQNQHSALSLVNNVLYVPFGGHYGDGGNYHGWVVAIDITDPTKLAGWASAGGSEGIWAHGGLASDGTGVFAATGNGHAGSHNNANTDAEEVVRLTGMASLTRNAANVFYPTSWQQMDGTDKDFGSSSPTYVPLPAGSSPSAVLVAPAKPGHIYFLDATNLSKGTYPAAGGELANLVVADEAAESVYTAATVYKSASGLHATIDVSQNAQNCPGGQKGNHMIISMLIQPGQTPIAKEVWCAPVSGNTGSTQSNGPPISTTDGKGDALVWFMNGVFGGFKDGGGSAQLSAVDGDSGMPVVTTSGAACAGIQNMSFPIEVKGRIVVAANGHLCSWSPGGTL